MEAGEGILTDRDEQREERRVGEGAAAEKQRDERRALVQEAGQPLGSHAS